jgi:putative SOS response-associated peptidase YedK
MCGRSRCTLAPSRVAEAAGVPPDQLGSRWVGRDTFQPSYNVQPGTATPVVRVTNQGERIVETMT